VRPLPGLAIFLGLAQILMQEHALLAFVTLTAFHKIFAQRLLFSCFGYLRLKVYQKATEFYSIATVYRSNSLYDHSLEVFLRLGRWLRGLLTLEMHDALLENPIELIFFFPILFQKLLEQNILAKGFVCTCILAYFSDQNFC
jgi:hypothetical protein